MASPFANPAEGRDDAAFRTGHAGLPAAVLGSVSCRRAMISRSSACSLVSGVPARFRPSRAGLGLRSVACPRCTRHRYRGSRPRTCSIWRTSAFRVVGAAQIGGRLFTLSCHDRRQKVADCRMAKPFDLHSRKISRKICGERGGGGGI
jgi:hypothetical protein